MEELKTKRSLCKSQFTRTEKMLQKLMNDSNSVKEQLERRIDEMAEKWTEVQEAHDLYVMKITDEAEIKVEDKWIEELENRYEKIEREAVLALRKYDSSSAGVPSKEAAKASVSGHNTTKVGKGVELAKEIEKTQIQFERVKLDKFCGSIRKYPAWKERTDFYIKSKCPKSEQAFMLRSLLEPAVREEVENVEDDLELLWQRLDGKYGNVRKYVDLVLEDLSKVPKGDGSATLVMINTVEKSYRDLERIGSEQEMGNSYMIALIEKKLPEEMRLDWIKSVAEKGEVNSHRIFFMLMEFLAKWRKVLEYDAAAIRKVPDKKIVGKVNHASRNESKTNEGKEKCWIHEDGSHPVWNCKVFQMMDIKEKMEMVKDRKACHACLETACQGAEDASKCRKQFKCLMKGCGQPHNVLIHQ